MTFSVVDNISSAW